MKVPYLKKGDKVAITCPAKKLAKPMDDAVKLLQSWGLEVVLGETVNASYNQFAGDDRLRAHDLQRFINDNEVKAIFAARGGYGTVRIIDHVNFSPLTNTPKWIIGFSDITVLHAHLSANLGIETVHGQMPVNISDASSASLESLRKTLFGDYISYTIETNSLNKTGQAAGQLIGGNLSLLVSVLNSVSDYNYTNKILFIEDVGEYLYSVDRMIRCLDRAGKLSQLSALIVGGFTDIKDNEIPFGQTTEEIISAVTQKYHYPICFNFPAGHIPNNNALIFGRQVNLSVQSTGVTLNYTEH